MWAISRTTQLVLFAIISQTACIARPESIKLFSDARQTVNLEINGTSVRALGTIDRKEYQIDHAIRKYLKTSEEVFLVPKSIKKINQPFFILWIKTPSRPKAMGRGYCGAGYEESLLLIELHGNNFRLKDHMTLQSCIRSIVIYNEKDTTHITELLKLQQDGSYQYRLEEDGFDQNRVITIENGKFHVKVKMLEN